MAAMDLRAFGLTQFWHLIDSGVVRIVRVIYCRGLSNKALKERNVVLNCLCRLCAHALERRNEGRKLNLLGSSCGEALPVYDDEEKKKWSGVG